MADEESAAPVEVSDTQAPIEAAVADETVNLEEARLAQHDEETEEPAREEEQAEADPDDEEFDWNGKKIRGPKGLRDSVMMHADYTKKTQEVSARRKELDDRETSIKQQSEATEAELDLRSDLRSIDKRIKSYAEATREQWQQWSEQDPLAAQDGWREYQMLEKERNELTEKLNTAQSTRTATAQQETAKRLQETGEYARKLPGWTPEVEQKVIEFAGENGMTPQFLRENITPAYYHILYKAMVGDQALKKPAVPKQATPPPTPLKVIGAKQNAPNTKSVYDPDISMADYDALRSKQEAAKRARNFR